MTENVIIIGSGPAGLSAAIYTAREGFSPLVIGGFEAGGQLELTSVVENMPGFPEGVNGPDLITLMRKQAERFGARFIDQNVTSVNFKIKPFKVYSENNSYDATCVIVATGASTKWLGIDSERKFVGKGVSSCATCDAPLFKNKNVIVVGGGDTALEDAIFLTRFAKSVTVVHRRGELRASKIMQDHAFANPKITFTFNTTLKEIKGNGTVNSVVLTDTTSNKDREMATDGVFIAIGHEPNSSVFRGQLTVDDQGYIVTKDEVKTEIDGIYVAGDVADRVYKQAGTASGSGIKAALEVRSYLSRLQK